MGALFYSELQCLFKYSGNGERTKAFHNSLLITGDNGDALTTEILNEQRRIHHYFNF